MNVDTSLFSSTADIRFKYKPIDTSVNEVPVDSMHKERVRQGERAPKIHNKKRDKREKRKKK